MSEDVYQRVPNHIRVSGALIGLTNAAKTLIDGATVVAQSSSHRLLGVIRLALAVHQIGFLGIVQDLVGHLDLEHKPWARGWDRC